MSKLKGITKKFKSKYLKSLLSLYRHTQLFRVDFKYNILNVIIVINNYNSKQQTTEKKSENQQFHGYVDENDDKHQLNV